MTLPLFKMIFGWLFRLLSPWVEQIKTVICFLIRSLIGRHDYVSTPTIIIPIRSFPLQMAPVLTDVPPSNQIFDAVFQVLVSICNMIAIKVTPLGLVIIFVEHLLWRCHLSCASFLLPFFTKLLILCSLRTFVSLFFLCFFFSLSPSTQFAIFFLSNSSPLI